MIDSANLEALNRDGLTRLTIRKLTGLVCLISGLYILLYSVILDPLFIHFSSNVLYQDAWWLTVIGLSLDILDVALLILVYPLTVYALCRGGFRLGYRTVMAFSLFTLLKFAVNYAATCITEGSLPTGSVLGEDMAIILPGLAMELGLYWLVVLCTCIHMRGSRKRRAGTQDESLPLTDVFLPFERIFCFRNPIQRSVFDVALILFLFRVISHLIYQMTLIVWTGSPDPLALLLMDAGEDILVAVAAYLAGLLLVNRLHRRMPAPSPLSKNF